MAADTKVVLENSLDGYVTVANQIKGGYQSVDDLANISDRIKVEGMLVYCTKDSKYYLYKNGSWVVDETTKSTLGLDKVDNTSDADKPISTAQNTINEGLQSQIDAIKASSDVVDVVATKAALDNYDISKLGDNDIIKVLADETADNAISYYRYSTSSKSFTKIGSVGPYASDEKVQLNTTTLKVGNGSIVFEIDSTTKTLNIKITAQS